MEYGTQYLTYTEYTAFGGSITTENAFNLLEYEARKEIDSRTQNRIVGQETIPNEVKICVFNLINKIESIDAENNKSNIASESVGSYSVSYAGAEEIIESNKKQIDDIIKRDLYGVIINGTHVLYLGVD